MKQLNQTPKPQKSPVLQFDGRECRATREDLQSTSSGVVEPFMAYGKAYPFVEVSFYKEGKEVVSQFTHKTAHTLWQFLLMVNGTSNYLHHLRLPEDWRLHMAYLIQVGLPIELLPNGDFRPLADMKVISTNMGGVRYA